MPLVASSHQLAASVAPLDCCRASNDVSTGSTLQSLWSASNPRVFVLQGKRHDESESDDEWTDEEEDSAPLDNVDPFVFFADSLHSVQSQMPARFQVCSRPL